MSLIWPGVLLSRHVNCESSFEIGTAQMILLSYSFPPQSKQSTLRVAGESRWTQMMMWAICVCVSCSVVSNSLWSYGLQPTRLLCPWNSPGKNTGVGWHWAVMYMNLTTSHHAMGRGVEESWWFLPSWSKTPWAARTQLWSPGLHASSAVKEEFCKQGMTGITAWVLNKQREARLGWRS